jgi:hypothetical protein
VEFQVRGLTIPEPGCVVLETISSVPDESVPAPMSPGALLDPH